MSKLNRSQFIAKVAPMAVLDMEETKIPASLTIAQAILESSDGNSALTVQGNNLFGIKGTGTAGTLIFPTTEYINGKPVTVQAKFRSYNSWAESIKDHSKLFLNGVSWNRNLYKNVIGKDGITASREVAKAGYATDPRYGEKLIKLINDNALLKYDRIVEISPEFRIRDLENNVRTIMELLQHHIEEIPAPKWFVSEFPEALNLINQNTGTNDFWRAFAVALRIVKMNKIV